MKGCIRTIHAFVSLLLLLSSACLVHAEVPDSKFDLCKPILKHSGLCSFVPYEVSRGSHAAARSHSPSMFRGSSYEYIPNWPHHVATPMKEFLFQPNVNPQTWENGPTQFKRPRSPGGNSDDAVNAPDRQIQVMIGQDNLDSKEITDFQQKIQKTNKKVVIKSQKPKNACQMRLHRTVVTANSIKCITCDSNSQKSKNKFAPTRKPKRLFGHHGPIHVIQEHFAFRPKTKNAFCMHVHRTIDSVDTIGRILHVALKKSKTKNEFAVMQNQKRHLSHHGSLHAIQNSRYHKPKQKAYRSCMTLASHERGKISNVVHPCKFPGHSTCLQLGQSDPPTEPGRRLRCGPTMPRTKSKNLRWYTKLVNKRRVHQLRQETACGMIAPRAKVSLQCDHSQPIFSSNPLIPGMVATPGQNNATSFWMRAKAGCGEFVHYPHVLVGTCWINHTPIYIHDRALDQINSIQNYERSVAGLSTPGIAATPGL